uniref:hypothetical protein n=1 Tax=Salmonella sp. s58408 TaxID=3159701 RepID=UPI00397EC976
GESAVGGAESIPLVRISIIIIVVSEEEECRWRRRKNAVGREGRVPLGRRIGAVDEKEEYRW